MPLLLDTCMWYEHTCTYIYIYIVVPASWDHPTRGSPANKLKNN